MERQGMRSVIRIFVLFFKKIGAQPLTFPLLEGVK